MSEVGDDRCFVRARARGDETVALHEHKAGFGAFRILDPLGDDVQPKMFGGERRADRRGGAGTRICMIKLRDLTGRSGGRKRGLRRCTGNVVTHEPLALGLRMRVRVDGLKSVEARRHARRKHKGDGNYLLGHDRDATGCGEHIESA